jgi:hypothetical protein
VRALLPTDNPTNPTKQRKWQVFSVPDLCLLLHTDQQRFKNKKKRVFTLFRTDPF